MNLNHIFSLIAFALVALCFMAFLNALKPQPLYHPEMAVGSIYERAFSARSS
jgi:hypothetical protein